MPSPDPWIYTLPGIAFNPNDTSTTKEYFTTGDYFTISGTPPPGFGNLTFTYLAIGPLADFTLDPGSLGASNQLKFDYNGPTTGLFDPLTIGNIAFDATDYTPAIQVTYYDHVLDTTTHTSSTETGSNITYVPEPATLVMVSFSAVAGLFLARGVSRRRHAAIA